jgi:hypothetical protein
MDTNLTMANVLEIDDNAILEAAYLSGFEPSSDDIPAHKEVQEAIEFLTIKHVET